MMKIIGIIIFTIMIIFLVQVARLSELTNPHATILLLDRNKGFLAQVPGSSEHGYWPLKKLPLRVAAATLALEDRRFQNHPGVDPLAIIRALWQNFSAGRRISGASTIAMQVARLQHPGPRTYLHKTIEAGTAILMTLRYGRKQVLKQYLRLVSYGNNCRGIAYAARYYFDKPVEDLSWAQTAFLCALPHAPGRMNPFSSKGRIFAIQRGHRILAAIQKQVMPFKQAAHSQLENIQIPFKKRRTLHSLHPILKIQKELGNTNSPAMVITTIDPKIQETISTMTIQYLQKWKHKGIQQTSVIVAKLPEMEVLAWQGSGGYFTPAGAIDYNKIKRSPGSTLKPFIYALALENGTITPASILLDTPTTGRINNADRKFLGPLLPRQALANSRNIPAVTVLKKIGVEQTLMFLHKLKLYQGRYPGWHYGLGIAIGGLPVSPAQLINAYGVLANDGLFTQLHLYGSAAKADRVLSCANARRITSFLSDPMARLPAFDRLNPCEYAFPVAVKTGTSQGYRNAWTIAWSREYIVVVWSGRPDNQPMHQVSGSSAPARLVHQILEFMHPRTKGQDLDFPPPPGHQAVKICTRSGRLAGKKCPHTVYEWFLPQKIPLKICTKPSKPSKPIMLSIKSPGQGFRIYTNPETPAAMNSIALRVTTEPQVPQVLWTVDGQPYKLADPPFTVRWPLKHGTHRFQASIPFRRIFSKTIKIFVE